MLLDGFYIGDSMKLFRTMDVLDSVQDDAAELLAHQNRGCRQTFAAVYVATAAPCWPQQKLTNGSLTQQCSDISIAPTSVAGVAKHQGVSVRVQ